MICIKRQDYKDRQFYWIAEDADGVIGQITVKEGAIPDITRLEFEQAEIGDGLIKTAAAFFAAAGVPKLSFSVGSEKAKKAALAAGFLQTDNGLEINPAKVKRNCEDHGATY